MTVKFTQNQLNALLPFGEKLKEINASQYSSAYFPSNEKRQLADVYKQITNGCTDCGSEWIRRLAKWYVDYLNENKNV